MNFGSRKWKHSRKRDKKRGYLLLMIGIVLAGLLIGGAVYAADTDTAQEQPSDPPAMTEQNMPQGEMPAGRRDMGQEQMQEPPADSGGQPPALPEENGQQPEAQPSETAVNASASSANDTQNTAASQTDTVQPVEPSGSAAEQQPTAEMRDRGTMQQGGEFNSRMPGETMNHGTQTATENKSFLEQNITVLISLLSLVLGFVFVKFYKRKNY